MKTRAEWNVVLSAISTTLSSSKTVKNSPGTFDNYNNLLALSIMEILIDIQELLIDIGNGVKPPVT